MANTLLDHPIHLESFVKDHDFFNGLLNDMQKLVEKIIQLSHKKKNETSLLTDYLLKKKWHNNGFYKEQLYRLPGPLPGPRLFVLKANML